MLARQSFYQEDQDAISFTTKSFVNALLFTDSSISLTHLGNFVSEAQCLFVTLTHFFKSLSESAGETISSCLV